MTEIHCHTWRIHQRSDDRVLPSARRHGGPGGAPHRPVQLRAGYRIWPAGRLLVLARAPESNSPRI